MDSMDVASDYSTFWTERQGWLVPVIHDPREPEVPQPAPVITEPTGGESRESFEVALSIIQKLSAGFARIPSLKDTGQRTKEFDARVKILSSLGDIITSAVRECNANVPGRLQRVRKIQRVQEACDELKRNLETAVSSLNVAKRGLIEVKALFGGAHPMAEYRTKYLDPIQELLVGVRARFWQALDPILLPVTYLDRALEADMVVVQATTHILLEQGFTEVAKLYPDLEGSVSYIRAYVAELLRRFLEQSNLSESEKAVITVARDAVLCLARLDMIMTAATLVRDDKAAAIHDEVMFEIDTAVEKLRSKGDRLVLPGRAKGHAMVFEVIRDSATQESPRLAVAVTNTGAGIGKLMQEMLYHRNIRWRQWAWGDTGFRPDLGTAERVAFVNLTMEQVRCRDLFNSILVNRKNANELEEDVVKTLDGGGRVLMERRGQIAMQDRGTCGFSSLNQWLGRFFCDFGQDQLFGRFSQFIQQESEKDVVRVLERGGRLSRFPRNTQIRGTEYEGLFPNLKDNTIRYLRVRFLTPADEIVDSFVDLVPGDQPPDQ